MDRNENFVKDTEHLIGIEVKAENLLGQPIRRDQLNFVY